MDFQELTREMDEAYERLKAVTVQILYSDDPAGQEASRRFRAARAELDQVSKRWRAAFHDRKESAGRTREMSHSA